MKNKHVKQMMVNCGNNELLIKMIQQKIGSRCESMKRKGTYNFHTDLRNICIKTFNEFDYLFSKVTAHGSTIQVVRKPDVRSIAIDYALR